MARAAPLPLVTLAIVVGALGASCAKRPPARTSGQLPEPQDTEAVTRRIDELLRAEWQKASVIPSSQSDDAEFLRRAYLDTVGTLPPSGVISAFLADPAADKRKRAIDHLLQSARYVSYWTGYWERTLMGRDVRNGLVERAGFRDWLESKVASNAGWNHIVRELVGAYGQNTLKPALPVPPPPRSSASGATMAAAPPVQAAPSPTASSSQVNPAVNWLLRFNDSPQDFAGTASRLFLGVQIQCAQCHDHKTESWKQEDFNRFTACFARVGTVPLDTGNVMGTRRVIVLDVKKPPPSGKTPPANTPYLTSTPTALDGTDFSQDPLPRFAVASWITAPQNPYFARAVVNRFWAHFLNRGFVEPIDDLRPSNPPIAPEVLDVLSEDTVRHGYDLKRLIRIITSTQAYQLSSAPGAKAPGDGKLWSRFAVEPLHADELFSALLAATGLEPLLSRIPGANPEQLRAQLLRQHTFAFNVDEVNEEERFSGTIAQALLLINGSLTHLGATVAQGGFLNEVVTMPAGESYKIDAMYLQTLSRRPSAEEVASWSAFLHAARPVATTEGAKGGADPLRGLVARLTPGHPTAEQQAYEDMFWVLLNSTEFMFNH